MSSKALTVTVDKWQIESWKSGNSRVIDDSDLDGITTDTQFIVKKIVGSDHDGDTYILEQPMTGFKGYSHERHCTKQEIEEVD